MSCFGALWHDFEFLFIEADTIPTGRPYHYKYFNEVKGTFTLQKRGGSYIHDDSYMYIHVYTRNVLHGVLNFTSKRLNRILHLWNMGSVKEE